jgi:pimeloyl-ACP methyl ester carboxylesterase
VAIAPAAVREFRRGLVGGRFAFAVEVEALDELLAGCDLPRAVADLAAPLLIMHAEGDERVPVTHSRELARSFARPESRLIVAAGGHHRSVQHDEELQAVALRWLDAALGARA